MKIALIVVGLLIAAGLYGLNAFAKKNGWR